MGQTNMPRGQSCYSLCNKETSNKESNQNQDKQVIKNHDLQAFRQRTS